MKNVLRFCLVAAALCGKAFANEPEDLVLTVKSVAYEATSKPVPGKPKGHWTITAELENPGSQTNSFSPSHVQAKILRRTGESWSNVPRYMSWKQDRSHVEGNTDRTPIKPNGSMTLTIAVDELTVGLGDAHEYLFVVTAGDAMGAIRWQKP